MLVIHLILNATYRSSSSTICSHCLQSFQSFNFIFTFWIIMNSALKTTMKKPILQKSFELTLSYSISLNYTKRVFSASLFLSNAKDALNIKQRVKHSESFSSWKCSPAWSSLNLSFFGQSSKSLSIFGYSENKIDSCQPILKTMKVTWIILFNYE